MKPAPAPTDTFDPTAIAGLPPKDHNAPANDNVAIFTEIDDLYDEAKNFADGEPITSQEMHDAIGRLYDGIHDAGKRADALRVEEKRPLDDQVKAIQDRYNPYIQPKKGKVDRAKSSLADLLTPWRTSVAKKKAEEAARVAAEAEAARVAATEAIRQSSGNLAAREEAESLLQDAKALERQAGRANKAATVGTGLRTVWVGTIEDSEKALDWAYNRDPDAFTALVQSMADTAIRSGARAIPGFVITETKVAN